MQSVPCFLQERPEANKLVPPAANKKYSPHNSSGALDLTPSPNAHAKIITILESHRSTSTGLRTQVGPMKREEKTQHEGWREVFVWGHLPSLAGCLKETWQKGKRQSSLFPRTQYTPLCLKLKIILTLGSFFLFCGLLISHLLPGEHRGMAMDWYFKQGARQLAMSRDGFFFRMAGCWPFQHIFCFFPLPFPQMGALETNSLN